MPKLILTKPMQVEVSLISINLLKFHRHDYDNNLLNTRTEREGVKWIFLKELPGGEFQTEITETRESKLVEDAFSIMDNSYFLIAGSGQF